MPADQSIVQFFHRALRHDPALLHQVKMLAHAAG